jgi:hypothetical protein
MGSHRDHSVSPVQNLALEEQMQMPLRHEELQSQHVIT